MKVAEKAWLEYIDRLRRVNDTAASKMLEYLTTHEYMSAVGRKAALDYAYAISTQYGEAATALACEMYDAMAVASGVALPPAVPAETATYGDVAKAVNGSLKQTGSPEVASNAVGRLVKRSGVDTTMQNAIRDGAEWAWIPHGDTCAFCITLASNGWQRASKKALKNGHAEHIHANCDCTYAVRFDSRTEYAGYDPDEYLEQYRNAEGKTWQEKVNSMRRTNYATNRNVVLEQKRVAYERRQGLRKIAPRDIVNNTIPTNYARAIDSIFYLDGSDKHIYSKEELLKNLQQSPIGTRTIRQIRDSDAIIEIIDGIQPHTNRGAQEGRIIRIFSANNRSQLNAAQSVVHEMTHYWYNIGGCQHAEAICYSMELMHSRKKDFLTKDEWEWIVDLVKDAYPELKWEEGGYGDYTQFNFVRDS